MKLFTPRDEHFDMLHARIEATMTELWHVKECEKLGFREEKVNRGDFGSEIQIGGADAAVRQRSKRREERSSGRSLPVTTGGEVGAGGGGGPGR